jgi:hypothetical protein
VDLWSSLGRFLECVYTCTCTVCTIKNHVGGVKKNPREFPEDIFPGNWLYSVKKPLRDTDADFARQDVVKPHPRIPYARACW